MQTFFDELASDLTAHLGGNEVCTCSFHGEDSDFARFNQGAVRQAGHVSQRALSMDLIEGRRHASGSVTLSGDLAEDRARVERMLRGLREKLPHLPEDPHLLYATEVRSSETRGESALPEPDAALGAVQEAARGRDLVGLYAAGTICVGFANSLGQRNWYEKDTYNLDWSFYHAGDKAVKAAYAGFVWDDEAFARKVDLAVSQLEALARPPVRIPPGRYRVYLAPAAVHDMVGMLAWGGFGLKAQRTRQTPLIRLLEGEASLSPDLTIREDTATGLAPNFQSAGFIRPDHVTLIEAGRQRDCLVSPRSAKEYGVPTNGASSAETPESIAVEPGDVPVGHVLERLERGVYVGNVHYLNYSDRSACRTTGMTRFATFWVEDGAIRAPLDVMRFDETLYRVLGENLVGLTASRERILDPDTYGGRSTSSAHVPGAIVEDFTFTL